MNDKASLTGDFVDRFSQSLDVAGRDTGDGDAAVLGCVDGVLCIKPAEISE
jgi:hypothetical protein